jgi:hypothetical protein
MTAPNIAALTTITGKTATGAIGVSSSVLLANAASSNKVFKVNAIIVSNVDGTAGADATIGYTRASSGLGTTHYLASTITVPGDATLVVLGKDTPVYMEENTSIIGKSSAAGDLEYVISYEEIS